MSHSTVKMETTEDAIEESASMPQGAEAPADISPEDVRTSTRPKTLSAKGKALQLEQTKNRSIQSFLYHQRNLWSSTVFFLKI